MDFATISHLTNRITQIPNFSDRNYEYVGPEIFLLAITTKLTSSVRNRVKWEFFVEQESDKDIFKFYKNNTKVHEAYSPRQALAFIVHNYIKLTNVNFPSLSELLLDVRSRLKSNKDTLIYLAAYNSILEFSKQTLTELQILNKMLYLFNSNEERIVTLMLFYPEIILGIMVPKAETLQKRYTDIRKDVGTKYRIDLIDNLINTYKQ